MLIILGAVAVALAVVFVAMKRYKEDQSQLSESRPSPPVMGVQIICGDCSGGEERPVKTYLDRLGNCAHCGGSSFMLASRRVVYAKQLVAARLAESREVSSAALFRGVLTCDGTGTSLESVEAHPRVRAAS